MTFLLSSTFTDSLARLSGEEQKAVKTTAFDLQVCPANPGMSFHKLDHARDKNFWSVRVSSDLRIIVHRSEASLLLCYVDHHDKAYEWAERRRLETHPTTGAAQLVEIRESVKEVTIPVYARMEMPGAAPPSAPSRRPFEALSDEELLGYGVPLEWLHEVRSATEDSLLVIAEHLPAEAAEALLEIATGGIPVAEEAATSIAAEAAPPYGSLASFLHPDAQRRFRVMTNAEELERALDFPWEKWTVFLHPDQRELVERAYTGPFRVSGSAGTGKTIVALHRAVYLARRNPDARVLLTTFSDPLANALTTKLRALAEHEPRLGERIDIRSLLGIALRLGAASTARPRLATQGDIPELLAKAARSIEAQRFGLPFLLSEWTEIVDAWQINDRKAYREVPRLGRKTRIGEAQRDFIWPVFERLRKDLTERGLQTQAEFFTNLARRLAESSATIFDFIVADEAQDLSVAQLRFLVALGKHRPDSLFLHGRPRPAHLPATILMEVPRRRSQGEIAHSPHQLPHFAADQEPGRPPSRSGALRRRRNSGETIPDDIRAQRAASPAPDTEG